MSSQSSTTPFELRRAPESLQTNWRNLGYASLAASFPRLEKNALTNTPSGTKRAMTHGKSKPRLAQVVSTVPHIPSSCTTAVTAATSEELASESKSKSIFMSAPARFVAPPGSPADGGRGQEASLQGADRPFYRRRRLPVRDLRAEVEGFSEADLDVSPAKQGEVGRKAGAAHLHPQGNHRDAPAHAD